MRNRIAGVAALLVLAGGTVVDGTGAPGYRADVGVRGETIAAIGDLGRAEARRVIDATGLVVAPGFVDPHTHAEGALLTDPQHAMGLRQGITTEFLGIDGMSYAPLSPANYRLYRRWLSGLLGGPPDDPPHPVRARVRAAHTAAPRTRHPPINFTRAPEQPPTGCAAPDEPGWGSRVAPEAQRPC